MSYLSNPYIAGKTVSKGRGFVGREDILRLVEDHLKDPERNLVILFGQRRLGKTSILLELDRSLPRECFLPVYFDLMHYAQQPLGSLLADVAADMVEAIKRLAEQSSHLDGKTLKDGHGDDIARLEAAVTDLRREGNEATFVKQFLPALFTVLPTGRRPVLLFDEFDVLDQDTEQGLGPESANRGFFPYLEQLMQQEPRLGYVVVLGRKPEQLSLRTLAVFRSQPFSQRVSVLDETNARELILMGERQGSLRFDPAAVQRVLELTSGHPFLIQLLCQIVWDAHCQGPPPTLPQISASMIDAVVATALERGDHIFEWIWDGLPPAERVILAAVAEALNDKPAVSRDDLGQILHRHGIPMFIRELNIAPETLCDWELLRKHPQVEGYTFFVRLLQHWIVLKKPISRVREEIDRLIPQADRFYEIALVQFCQGDLDEADKFLRRALKENLHHLKARLLLTEVLCKQGKLEEAVQEAEVAFEYDEQAARWELFKTLLAHGEALEQQGDLEAALSRYERARRLSPKDPTILRRCAAIFTAQGEAALAADKLDQARALFEKAGDSERIKQCQEALAVENHITEAKRALAGRNFPLTLRLLADILIECPDYRDTAGLVVDAYKAADALARMHGQSPIAALQEEAQRVRAEYELLAKQLNFVKTEYEVEIQSWETERALLLREREDTNLSTEYLRSQYQAHVAWFSGGFVVLVLLSFIVGYAFYYAPKTAAPWANSNTQARSDILLR